MTSPRCQHSALSRAIGARLRQLREARHLSQATVAAELGVNKNAVQATEAGRNNHSIGLLAGYARVLGVRVQTLLEPLDFEALCALEPVAPVED